MPDSQQTQQGVRAGDTAEERTVVRCANVNAKREKEFTHLYTERNN